MNTPEPVKKILIVDKDRPVLGSKARVIKKLTKKQSARRTKFLLRNAQLIRCERCHKPGGTMCKLQHTEDGQTLYVHVRCK